MNEDIFRLTMPDLMGWTIVLLGFLYVIAILLKCYSEKLNRKIKGLNPGYCPYCGKEKENEI